MSKRMKVNLILLAMMVLPPLSSLLLRYEGTMAIAMTPVLGYVYPCLPFSALQVLLCCNFRGRFSRLVRRYRSICWAGTWSWASGTWRAYPASP